MWHLCECEWDEKKSEIYDGICDMVKNSSVSYGLILIKDELGKNFIKNVI